MLSSSSLFFPKFINQSNSTIYFLRQPPPHPTNIRRITSTAAFPSFYEVLGISTAASYAEIKVAYRRLAKSCHPDVAGGWEVGNMPAADEFIRVNDAYQTLSDPDKRAKYDRGLFLKRSDGVSVSTRTNSSSSLCVPRKNWESDQCW